MAKFKNGDRVALLRDKPCGRAGDVGTIAEVHDGWFSTKYQVQMSGIFGGACEVSEDDIKKV